MQFFSTLQSLVEAVLEIEVLESSRNQVNANGESAGSSNAAFETPAQKIKRLEESRRCKKCLKEDACVVFIPCGHLATCIQCSEQVERCLLCKKVIREKVRSYLS